MVRRAVFLDRDGVLNANRFRDGKAVAPVSFAEFELLPGVAEAVSRLKAAGFLAIICTNQPDQTNGRSTPEALAAMHAHLTAHVAIDDIRVCPHVDADGCDCRKPLPGLLTGAAADHGIDLAKSYMVGDRWRDIDAGHRAGVRAAYLVNAEPGEGALCSRAPDGTFPALPQAVDAILQLETSGAVA